MTPPPGFHACVQPLSVGGTWRLALNKHKAEEMEEVTRHCAFIFRSLWLALGTKAALLGAVLWRDPLPKGVRLPSREQPLRK